MEDTISGFKVRGDWPAVVEHGERITRALRDSGFDEDDEPFAEWDEWRPKAHERLSEDVNEKTAEQAATSEGEGERAGKSADEDMREAGERLTESYRALDEEGAGGAIEKWQDSISHVERAVDTAGRKALRAVEDAVYRKVMTRFTPYYFDNELVSANIQRAGDEYVFEVNINDDDLKAEARERLSEYESEVDRWHVDTEKATETAAAAEGVEPPAEPNRDDADATTN
ncbi:MAG: DUF5828 family protein [Halobacteriaceae archaeon]